MHPAIEQIFSCDETARASVEQARRDGDRLMAEAGQKAEKMLVTLREEIRQTELAKKKPSRSCLDGFFNFTPCFV